MTWAWVGTIWMVVVFVIGCIVVVGLLVVLYWFIRSAVNEVRTGLAKPQPVTAAPPVVAPVKSPARDNVIPIMRGGDE